MKTILDQIITNFPSETWLREQRNMEADDEATAYVVSAATPPVERVPLTLIQTRATALDDDPDDCDTPWCFYRSLHESRRSDTAGAASTDAVTR